MDPSAGLIRRHRPFAAYWAGQGLSSLGSQVSVFALPLVTVLTLQASPADVGLVAAAGTLPYLLFSLVAGHLLEGRPKRAVMIPADLVQAVLIGLIPVAWAAGVLSVPLLAAIAFGSGTAALCFGVVGFSYVPELVGSDDLAAANRAVQGTRTVAEIAGPGLAGLLVGVLGAPLALLVDAASYVASAVGVALARPRRDAAESGSDRDRPESRDAAPPAEESPDAAGAGEPAAPSRPPFWAGLHLLFDNRYLRALTLHAALFNLAEEVFLLNLVLWVVRGQGLPAAWYGLALSAAGVGGLVGTLIALRLADRLGLGRAFVAALVLSCGAPLLATLWPGTGIGLAVAIGAVMFVAGVGLGNANVFSLTLRQTVIPADQLTRSAGAYTQIMYGSIPLGGVLAGVAGQALGPQLAARVGAVGLVLAIVPMLDRAVLALRDAQGARTEAASAASGNGVDTSR